MSKSPTIPKMTIMRRFQQACACSRIVPLRYVDSVSADLAHRVQVAFDRCKAFPEAGKQGAFFMVRGDAYLALLELRNLAPEIVLALGPQRTKPREGFGPQQRGSSFAETD